MSYGSMFRCFNDHSLRGRVTACCADEGVENAEEVAFNMMWTVATADDIAAAYASALAANNPDPGGDETVVTDGMILGVVQAHLPPPT
jgi:hypothetical protein